MTPTIIDDTQRLTEMQNRWATTQEDLLPNLTRYIRTDYDGCCFDHPLHRQLIYSPAHNASINEIVSDKRRRAIEAWKKGEFENYVFLHHRPYRVDALVRVIKKIGMEATWQLASHVWTDSESAGFSMGFWKKYWQRATETEIMRQKSHAFMSNADRKSFSAIPSQVTIYRGAESIFDTKSFSWTLDRRVAKWFAYRKTYQSDSTCVIRAIVPKNAIYALLNDRNEAEAIVDLKLAKQGIIDCQPISLNKKEMPRPPKGKYFF